MSSLQSNANRESVIFHISNLFQFYKTNYGQVFESKSISINNINFQVYIYPNGQRKEQFGKIQFIVEPIKFINSNIKSITVSVALYCKKLELMFKEVAVISKPTDIIRWTPYYYQLHLTEFYQNIIIKNEIKQLEFVCDMEILQILYKKNSSIGHLRKLSLHSVRKKNSISLSNDNNNNNDIINTFEPQQSFSIKSYITINWPITNKMVNIFINTRIGKSYYTQNINNMWCLCLYPNGTKQKNKGSVLLLLQLMRLPSDIKSIEIDYEIQRKQQQIVQVLDRRCNVLFSYNESQKLSDLFASSLLNAVKSFTLTVIIKINKIYKDINKKGKGREVKDSWSDFGFDQIKPTGMFQCGYIDYGQFNKAHHDEKTSTWTSSTGDIVENIPNNDEEEEKYCKTKPVRRKSFKRVNQKERTRQVSYSSLVPPTSSMNRPSITPFYRDRNITFSQSSSPLNTNKERLNDIEEDVELQESNKEPSNHRNKKIQNKVKVELWDDHNNNNNNNNNTKTIDYRMRKTNVSVDDDDEEEEDIDNDDNDEGQSDHIDTAEHTPGSLLNHDEQEKLVKIGMNEERKEEKKEENKNNMNMIGIDNVFGHKFMNWLCDDVQLTEYLNKFQSMGCGDIRLIKHFDDDMLLNVVGITNEWHRKLILDEVCIFRKLQKDFIKLVDKHQVLRRFKQIFKKKGILTRVDLESIEREKDLQKILNISSDDDRIAEIWNIIHPSQSRLQSQMNQLQQQHKLTIDSMESFIQSIVKMQNKISETKPNSPTREIQQQQDSIFNDYYSRLTNHRSILDKLQRNNTRPYFTDSNRTSFAAPTIPSSESMSSRQIQKNNKYLDVPLLLSSNPELILEDSSLDTMLTNNTRTTRTKTTTISTISSSNNDDNDIEFNYEHHNNSESALMSNNDDNNNDDNDITPSPTDDVENNDEVK